MPNDLEKLFFAPMTPQKPYFSSLIYGTVYEIIA